MNDFDDPLWNPAAAGDADLRRLRTLLAPYGAAARGIGEWKPQAAARARRWRRAAMGLAACLAASLVLYAGYAWRLAWSDGRPWRIEASAATPARLAPGATLQTGAQESLTVAVARIGSLRLSPQSALRLVQTRSGQHRVALDRGHLRARIWAPPGYFGVDAGAAELVDLGCDFDVWKDADGRGRVYVRSGWVAYRLGAQEVLLPSGFAMDFDARRAWTPLRPAAAPGFVHAVRELERILEGAMDAHAAEDAAGRVASAATDADAFTLLSLLTRHPSLARGALYPRLARALSVAADDSAHRGAWLAGDASAIEAWWQRMPTQPKHWWSNWADALP
jgi:hypothetical protein